MIRPDSSDYAAWRAKNERRGVDDHPLRDTSKESFFDAMLSDEANPARGGFLSPEALKILSE